MEETGALTGNVSCRKSHKKPGFKPRWSGLEVHAAALSSGVWDYTEVTLKRSLQQVVAGFWFSVSRKSSLRLSHVGGPRTVFIQGARGRMG